MIIPYQRRLTIKGNTKHFGFVAAFEAFAEVEVAAFAER